MRLWISKSSEVPVHEQLTTQIMLGITSGDLKPSQKLPSTRELARRFGVHPNTVNAAYRSLSSRGWVEFRKGSGVFVRTLARDVQLNGKFQLDQLIWSFLKIARSKGFSLAKIRSRVRSWMQFQLPDHLLVIEPDMELRHILLTELSEVTEFPVSGLGLEDCRKPGALTGSFPVALYARAEEVRAVLPLNTDCMMLHSCSLQENTLKFRHLPPDAPIAVVSRWSEFLRWARTTLVAAGVDPAGLSLRDAREKGWQAGLRFNTHIIADVAASKLLPPGNSHVMVIRVISESALSELRAFIKDFLTSSSPVG